MATRLTRKTVADDAAFDRWAGEQSLASHQKEYRRLFAELDRLRAWVADLQSGQYVNCVYCGHRYGPGETTPVSMADALKAHVERCPAHPMSALKAENAHLRQIIESLVPGLDDHWLATPEGTGASTAAKLALGG